MPFAVMLHYFTKFISYVHIMNINLLYAVCELIYTPCGSF